MIDIGRVCVKLAGRDAGKKCVVVDVIDDKYVLIDGETRRRKCNIMHLEPLDMTVEIGKGASHEAVVKAVKDLGWEPFAPKTKPKPAPRPRKARRSKLAQATLAAAAAPAGAVATPAATPAAPAAKPV